MAKAVPKAAHRVPTLRADRILPAQQVSYCIACGAPIEIPLAVPGTAIPPQLALVERKYSTIRRALFVEAGVLVVIAGQLLVLELVADVAFGGSTGCWRSRSRSDRFRPCSRLACGSIASNPSPSGSSRGRSCGAPPSRSSLPASSTWSSRSPRRVRRDGRQRPIRRRGDEGPGRVVRVPAAT